MLLDCVKNHESVLFVVNVFHVEELRMLHVAPQSTCSTHTHRVCCGGRCANGGAEWAGVGVRRCRRGGRGRCVRWHTLDHRLQDVTIEVLRSMGLMAVLQVLKESFEAPEAASAPVVVGACVAIESPRMTRGIV